MATFEYNKHRVAWYEEGEGPPLILIHGFCEDAEMWRQLIPAIPGYRIICIDLPGFGRSEAFARISIDGMAEIVKALIDRLRLGPCVVMGHSMGGYVLAAFARKYPDALLGAGMLHSHPFADTEGGKAGRNKGLQFIEENGQGPFVRKLMPRLFPEQFYAQHPELIRTLIDRAISGPERGVRAALIAMRDRPSNASAISQLKCPVLFVLGREDAVIPIDIALEQTQLPDIADIHLLEKVGHMGIFETPEQLATIICHFMERCLPAKKKLLMLNQIGLILVAVIPGLAISYLIYRQDRHDREPKLLLLICFVLGMLITFPAIKLEGWAESVVTAELDRFFPLLFVSFIVVGLTEELVKFVALFILPYRHKAFSEPMDGIIYAVMISMGFATLENLLYADRYGIQTILFRALTAVPAHGVFAVIMGYYAGLAKFDGKNRNVLIFKSLLYPFLLHGLYDFFILQEYSEWLMTLATLSLFIGMYFAILMIRAHMKPVIIKHTEEVVIAVTKAEKAVDPPPEENEITTAVLLEMKDEEE